MTPWCLLYNWADGEPISQDRKCQRTICTGEEMVTLDAEIKLHVRLHISCKETDRQVGSSGERADRVMCCSVVINKKGTGRISRVQVLLFEHKFLLRFCFPFLLEPKTP